MLLIGAGLLLHSFSRLMAMDRGFQGTNVLTVDLNFSGFKYRPMFSRQLIEDLESTPGITAAGVVSLLPVTNESDMVGVLPREVADNIPVVQRPHANLRWASSGYFRALHIRLIAGRLFEAADRARHVVLLSPGGVVVRARDTALARAGITIQGTCPMSTSNGRVVSAPLWR